MKAYCITCRCEVEVVIPNNAENYCPYCKVPIEDIDDILDEANFYHGQDEYAR